MMLHYGPAMGEDNLLAARLRGKMMHAMVEAALGGHDLSAWEPASRDSTRKFRATGSKRLKSVDVSTVANYSVLADTCPGS